MRAGDRSGLWPRGGMALLAALMLARTGAAALASAALCRAEEGAASAAGVRLATGAFREHMQVALTNDGPVTFWLECAPAPRV